jgi:hypothetical protein
LRTFVSLDTYYRIVLVWLGRGEDVKRSKLKPNVRSEDELTLAPFEIAGVSDKNSALLVLDATITKVNESTRLGSMS